MMPLTAPVRLSARTALRGIIHSAVLLLAMNGTALAEAERETGIYFGAMAGSQVLDFKRHFAVDVEPRLYPLSIGAGSAWTRGNYVIGLEFLYSSATSDSAAGEMQYVGFSNALSLGFNVSRDRRWKVEPNLGVALVMSQLIVQDRGRTTFQNLVNDQVCGRVGLDIKFLDGNGLFVGARLGYVFPFSGRTEWKDKVSGSPSGLEDNVGAFYIQLNLGGLLDLTRRE